MIDKIGNKILDLRDEGLGTSPDSEDLQGVLEDLEELEKANVYPCKIKYFSNISFAATFKLSYFDKREVCIIPCL